MNKINLLRALVFGALLGTMACAKGGSGNSTAKAAPVPSTSARSAQDADLTDITEAAPETPPVRPQRGSVDCAKAYRNTSPDWQPGLPFAPLAHPILTGGTKDQAQYTDARRDGVMAFAVDQANAVAAGLQLNSRALASRLRELSVQGNFSQAGAVKVQIRLAAKTGAQVVVLSGQLTAALGQSGGELKLVQIPDGQTKATDLQFSGSLRCMDREGHCETVLLRLDQLAADRRLLASAFVVHRYGPAMVTMSESDRLAFARLHNLKARRLAQTLAAMTNDVCGRFETVSPQYLRLRSWAAAYGTAAFEVILPKSSTNPEAIHISGPLWVSNERPMVSHPLLVKGATETLDKVYLMTNDGGGNLNFVFGFTDQPESRLRISVTSLLPNTIQTQLAEAQPTVKPSRRPVVTPTRANDDFDDTQDHTAQFDKD